MSFEKSPTATKWLFWSCHWWIAASMPKLLSPFLWDTSLMFWSIIMLTLFHKPISTLCIQLNMTNVGSLAISPNNFSILYPMSWFLGQKSLLGHEVNSETNIKFENTRTQQPEEYPNTKQCHPLSLSINSEIQCASAKKCLQWQAMADCNDLGCSLFFHTSIKCHCHPHA